MAATGWPQGPPPCGQNRPAALLPPRLTMQLVLHRWPGSLLGDRPQALAPLDAALLAWLALEGPTSREQLAALLWPDKPPATARNALRQRLFRLRRTTGIDLERGGGVLALAQDIAHDLGEADTVLGQAPAEEIAPGEFAQWLQGQRERRRQRARQAQADRADAAEAERDWPTALGHAQALLALDPLSEPAHRRLMRLHYLAGDRAAALLAFDRCEQSLKDEIGARHRLDGALPGAGLSADASGGVV